MLQAWSIALGTSLVLSATVFYFERWRLARAGGTYAAADFSGVILLAATAASWLTRLHEPPSEDAAKLTWLWLAAALVFVVGTLTDQFKPVRGLRALAAALAAWLLYDAGIAITTVKLPFSSTFVSFGGAALLVGMVWLALCGSLFARTGTLPRVSLGVGALTSLTFVVVAILEPANATHAGVMAAATIALVCLAQLPFTAYLTHGGATAGSYTLGVLIGALAIEGALKNTAFLVALLPLLVISVPLFTAVYAWGADWLRGRGRNLLSRHPQHVHEMLARQGYNEAQVSAVLLLGTGMVCGLAVLLVALIKVTFIIKALVLAVGLLAAVVVPYVALRLMKPPHPPRPAEEYELLGVRIHRVTMPEAMDRVAQFIREGTPHLVVTTDAGGVIRAQDDPEMRRIINRADLVTADGAGVVLAARLLNLGIDTRVAGCDMVAKMCGVAAAMGRSVYLLGAASGVAEKAAEKLQEQVPGLRIAGVHDGYFTADQEAQIIADICRARPAVLFVALGAPRQEKWIVQHMQELGVPVCIGIGGSLDVISGLKKRAPAWMQRCGLEWLYRAAKEPTRIRRLSALPRIVFLAFAEMFRAPRQPDN